MLDFQNIIKEGIKSLKKKRNKYKKVTELNEKQEIFGLLSLDKTRIKEKELL